MESVTPKLPGVVAVALLALLSSPLAWGQQGATSSPVQTLDQVDVFDRNVVLDMDFYDRFPGVEFKNLGIAGTGLSSCKLFGEGLYCLEVDDDGFQVVRFWKDAQKPAEHVDLFRCNDSALGLTGSRPCTGLTVDLSREVWVAGKKAVVVASTGRRTEANFSLLKVSADVCSRYAGSPWLTTDRPSPAAQLCAKEFASGDGTLTDLNAVDGEVAARLPLAYHPGVLALLDSREVLYFNLAGAGDDPITFGSWGLGAGVRLLSTTVLQVPASSGPAVTNYILATTSAGQIRSKPIVADPQIPSAVVTSVFDISAWELQHPGPASVRINASNWSHCLTPAGRTTCNIPAVGATGATLTTSGGSGFAQKTVGDATGIGIAGGGAGPEIDGGETLTVAFAAAQSVSAFEIVFLFNGPEFGDKAEVAKVTTSDGTVGGTVDYTLSVGNALDDDGAIWSGPGSVSKCGPTTLAGSGCFRISNPFPGPVTSMAFATSPGGDAFSLSGAVGTNESDYSIGSIETAYYGLRTSAKTGRAYLSNKDYSAVLALAPDAYGVGFTELKSVQVNQADLTLGTAAVRPEGITVAPGIIFDLADCTVNCDLLKNSNGVPLLSLSSVKATGPTKSRLYEVRDVPDCRYIPQVCTEVLGLPGATPGAAVNSLIAAGVIVRLDSGPMGLSPAAQMLNVSPLLPEDIQSLFDGTTTPPGGLPPLLISKWYRGQATTNDYRFNGFFFRSDQGVVFTDTYFGEIDVLALTNKSLGCFPPAANATIADRLKWDLITTVSEDVKSVKSGDNFYIDTLTNVGCRNPTKIAGGRTSFFPYNLEVASDTYGPTVRSSTPSVTLKNDGVFARLLQSLYSDLRTTLVDYTCTPPATSPLTKLQCDALLKFWTSGKQKLDKCVNAAFQPKSSASNENCQSFRNQFASYKAALPATTSPRADPDNRLGEQKWRWEVISHVFETRFLPSIPRNGYCRERTAQTTPIPYAGCPSPILSP